MAKEDRRIVRRRDLQNYDTDSILEYLRQLARKLGKDTLTRHDIRKDGQLHQSTIHRKFGGFSEALMKAGLKPGRIYKRNRDVMIQELARLMKKLGREPNKSEIDKALNYKARHYVLEFGAMTKAFDLAEDLLKTDTTLAAKNIPATAVSILKKTARRRRYGSAIEFRGLRHAPINELGVVFLFGMLAEELGFQVESIQASFPDCDAKTKSRDGTFERIMIEFEFKSSSFAGHGHDPDACDFLVCWQHDWKDCPDSLVVIELSTIIEGKDR